MARRRRTDNRAGRPLTTAEIMDLQRKLYARSEYRTCATCDGSGGKAGNWCVICQGAGKVRVPMEGML